jgi:hypothetical protein
MGMPVASSASRALFPPLLPVGFHRTDLTGLRRLCVDYFPESLTRPRLMNTVTMVISLINRVSIPARLWIDGGFLTEEENPEHCCLMLVLVESVYRRMSVDQREFFDWFRAVSLFEKYNCYNYAIVLDADRDDFETIHNFWLRQYGFHHEKYRKGVAEILVPTLAGT